MSEYIERQKAIEALTNNALIGETESGYTWFYTDEVYSTLKTTPSADVVQVVRCKNCKYRGSDDFCVGRGFPYQLVAGDEFCSRAKMKEHTND